MLLFIMRVLFCIAVLLLVSCGVEPEASPTVDQCMRVELFQSCLKATPASPSAVGGDSEWAEIITNCDRSSHYQSLRLIEHIKPECRTTR